MLITQNNLKIRNALPADAPLLGKWWRDGKVMAHAGFPNGLSITDEEIAKSLETDTDETHRRLVIEANSLPIGEMNYRNKGNNTAEIGIKICDFSMQEKGYGTKLLNMLISELFGKYGYEKIILDTNLNNKRARHVYEKIGFRKTGEQINSWKDQIGELQSFVEYELDKPKYFFQSEKDNEIINKWDAEIYDQTETQTNDIDFLINVIKNGGKRVLEVCCGSGRILVPLAKSGFDVTGFDKNEYMLALIAPKAEGLKNIGWSNVDAVHESWESGFDTVVLAGNIMINIETDMDYKQAQQLFIKKAYDSLLPGGYVYLDFDCIPEPEREKIYGFNQPNVGKIIWYGTDKDGNTASSKLINCGYDSETQICTFERELIFAFEDGRTITKKSSGYKHIPTLLQVINWLEKTGFNIEKIYGGYNGEPHNEKSYRAIIQAKK